MTLFEIMPCITINYMQLKLDNECIQQTNQYDVHSGIDCVLWLCEDDVIRQ